MDLSRAWRALRPSAEIAGTVPPPQWKAPRTGGMFALRNFFSVGANLRFAEKLPETFAASGPALPATLFCAGRGL